ncbi:hypothetical protein F3Y22_tig00111095pilonHSYRG00570 [Hibiscus syriacus]|uniref:Uncharacterized protein n=1 Tax=Hibiscus syriacus TaxID=106335 RepID=A0A6A2Z184_HIBSY|nr:hypothetical protein F3Y22_tig00111095pilonHSYRG00570 [Hibiscus syriacus]
MFEDDIFSLVKYDLEKGLGDYSFDAMVVCVRIYNIPLGSMTKEMGLTLGDCIGSVLDVNIRPVGRILGEFLCVRVEIDITKPLQRCVLLGNGKSGKPRICPLNYELLPTFCHKCVTQQPRLKSRPRRSIEYVIASSLVVVDDMMEPLVAQECLNPKDISTDNEQLLCIMNLFQRLKYRVLTQAQREGPATIETNDLKGAFSEQVHVTNSRYRQYGIEGSYQQQEVIDIIITSTIKEELVKPFAPAEVVSAFNDINPRKAPGIYGLPANFFRQHWSPLGDDVINFCLDLLIGHKSMCMVNKTILELIPKVEEPKLAGVGVVTPNAQGVVLGGVATMSVVCLDPGLTELHSLATIVNIALEEG